MNAFNWNSVIAHRCRRLGLLISFVLVVAFGCIAVERTYHFGFRGTDDANIFFRYARNLMTGYGTVYNEHAEPVEGFTSALWMVLCAYAELLGRRSTFALFGVNVVLAAASLSLVTISCRRQLRGLGLRAPVLLVASIVAASALLHPGWFLWNVTSLMDTGLYTFCIVLAWSALELLRHGSPKAPNRLATAAVLLVLCRPEGLGWLALLAISTWVVGRLSGVPRALFRSSMGALLVAGAVTATALMSWRILTFHLLLPNPLYAKISAPMAERLKAGMEHALSYLRIHPLWLSLALLLPITGFARSELSVRAEDGGTARRSRRTRSVLAALLIPWVWVLAGWIPPIAAGGDVFGGHRFFQVVHLLLVPPFILGAALLVQSLPRSRWWIGAFAGLGAIFCAAALGHWRAFTKSNTWGTPILDISEHVASEFMIAEADRAHGERLAALFGAPLPRIAYAAAGGISIGYTGTIYDMMGLNDPETAQSCRNKLGPLGHACFDRSRFFALAPDALLPRAAARGTPLDLTALAQEFRRPGNWDNTIFRRLFSDPEFNAKYRMVRITREGSDWTAYGYFSVPYLLALAVQPEFLLEFAK